MQISMTGSTLEAMIYILLLRIYGYTSKVKRYNWLQMEDTTCRMDLKKLKRHYSLAEDLQKMAIWIGYSSQEVVDIL